MKDLIFDIFTALAETALEDSCDIELRYENSQHRGKTIISESNTDIDGLTMKIYPPGSLDGASEPTDDEEDIEQD